MRQQAYEVLDGLIKSNSSSSGGGEVVDKTPLFNIDLGERPTNIMVKTIENQIELDKSKLKDEIYITIKDIDDILYPIKLNNKYEISEDGTILIEYIGVDPIRNYVIDLFIMVSDYGTGYTGSIYYDTDELNTIVIYANENGIGDDIEEQFNGEAIAALDTPTINKIKLIFKYAYYENIYIFTQFYNSYDNAGNGWSWDSEIKTSYRDINIHFYNSSRGSSFRYSSKPITTT